MKLLVLNLKQAFRNLRKNTWQTLISVLGMVLGVVCLSFSLNWLYNEMNYDAFRPDYRDIYQVIGCSNEDSLSYVQGKKPSGVGLSAPYPVYENIREALSEDVRISLVRDMTWSSVWKDMDGNELFCQNSYAVHPDFADIFGLKSVEGDVRTVLKTTDQMVISESRAKQLFGDSSAIGRKLRLETNYFLPDGVQEYTIGAIIADVPHKLTNMPVEFLIPFPKGVLDTDWNNYNYMLFLKTSDRKATEAILRKTGVKDQPIWESHWGLAAIKTVHVLYLRGGTDSEVWKGLIYPLAFTAVSLLLLLSALFNYIAILTSLFLNRMREYNLRISMGGSYRTNRVWLWTEVCIIWIFVSFLALIVQEWVTYFANIPEASIGIYRMLSMSIITLLCLLLLGSVYPLYRLKQTYKARFNGVYRVATVNKGLLLVQLVVCPLLLFVLFNAYRQMHSIFTADMGFKTENILRIQTSHSGDSRYNKFGRLFYELEDRLNGAQSPHIMEALAMQSDLFEGIGYSMRSSDMIGGFDVDRPRTYFRILTLPYKTRDFFDLNVAEGEWFSAPGHEAEEEVILNPEVVANLGIPDWAERHLTRKGERFNEQTQMREPVITPLKVRGVVSFRTKSLHTNQQPLFISCSPDGRTNHGAQWNHNAIYVKYVPGHEAEARADIRKIMLDVGVPEDIIVIERMRDRILSLYDEEQNYLNVFTVITVGSVLITLFGVLSMVLYTLRLQRRSIAIRRVFGATFGTICRLYLRGYVLYTVLGCVIAYPVGSLIMDWWLEGYDVRVSVGWWQGVVVLALMLLLVTLVVLLQIRRVMRENPADVVKSE